ncbi:MULTISPECIES: WecB/TagA/CpsF family glycosyltransferase [Collinsella]|uniref:WecB/TagA/CpsF family glycosyltransferase n=1 Tax=Collinsella TaxID=102106 RepID=UPI000B389D9D|nr:MULTISPECIES: WecB/TagA/CpsF family glycosyltransferase [Collinsella]MBM6682565.1 WecB/TagA/CpsF family glycosyltransferase [Collinsella intestinalis]OUO22414.1 glycosyltransferase [Collinsella sp. An307]
MAEGTSFPGRVAVMGVPVDPWTMAQTVAKTKELIGSDSFAHLIGVNADKVLQMRDDPEMDAIVRRCEIVNADGASMVMAARRLGVSVPERVAGIDLMGELCALAENEGYRVFLLGAKREIVERTRDVLLGNYPELPIAGVRDGYFGEDEFDAVADEVRASGAQITFVGITSPKKERLIERFRELGLKGAYVGVGGSFDVVSGAIPRAPIWMQRAHLEWLFRMMQEPGRLAKRYVVGNARFMALLRKEEKRMKGASR